MISSIETLSYPFLRNSGAARRTIRSRRCSTVSSRRAAAAALRPPGWRVRASDLGPSNDMRSANGCAVAAWQGLASKLFDCIRPRADCNVPYSTTKTRPGRIRMPAGYRLISYLDAGMPRAGVLIDGRVVNAEAILGRQGTSVLDILRGWDDAHPRLARASGADGVPLASLKTLAPVLYPGAFYCAGANYWDHLQEMAEIAKRTTGKEVSLVKPAEPW